MMKNSSLLPDSSSDDEDQQQQQQLEDSVVKKNMKDKEPEEEEEEEEEEDDESIFTVKKHESASSSSSMGEEEEEEEEEEESARSDLPVPPPPPPPPRNSNITPIPMFPLSGAKRVLYEAADNKAVEGEVSKKKRRKKQKKNGGGGVVDEGEVSEMMKSCNKLWSKDDEVVILKGLLSLINKHGAAKPTSELINELHQNIKPLLQAAQVTNDQLYGKIRKLKQKYLKGTINDSELANKIWGTSTEKEEVDFKLREEEEEEEEMTDEQAAINGGGVDSAVRAKEERKNTTRNSNASKTNISPQQQLPLLPSFFNEIIKAGKNSIVPPPVLKRFLTKEALQFIQGSKAKDLEEKWNKLEILEAKIYLDRLDLVKEQVKLLLDAFGTEE